jgi:glycerophosphodiester phosphodiesterase
VPATWATGFFECIPTPCRALRQRQARFPVLFLSTGGTCWHTDERRMSIAAAVVFALEANLQGLVLDSGAVQQQPQAVTLARSKGLKVS